MKNAKLLLFPLATLVLAVAVALVLTWVTATPEEKGEIADWVHDRIGHEDPDAGIRQIDWDALPHEIIAWVGVPGTEIDEPIVQADPTYPNRWLYADVFGEGGYGTPYIDCDCSLEGPFTIVYGHHMDDGSVFAGFANYSDSSYAEEHDVIYLYTRSDNQRHELKVIAANVVNANYESLQTEFEDQKAFEEYVSSCLADSETVLVDSEGVSHLYAFATCSYETWNSRTVVYAIEEGGER